MSKIIIAIGSDHAGFAMKLSFLKNFEMADVEFIDLGTDNDASCDYPVFAKKVCESVTNGDCTFGLLICGTGIGMSMAANKIKNIRAAVAHDVFSAKFTRLHNDANVLCLGARVIDKNLAFELLEIFIKTEFEGGKHSKRIAQFE